MRRAEEQAYTSNWVPEAAAPSSEGRADPVSHKGGWGQTQVAAPSPSQSERDLSGQLSLQGPALATAGLFGERERVGGKPGY